MLTTKEGIGNVAPNLTSEQALADQSMTPKQKLANIAGMAKVSGAATGFGKFIAQHVLGESPLSQLHSNMKKMLTDLPPASETYNGPLRSEVGQAPLKLPANASAANPEDHDLGPDTSFAGTVNGSPVNRTTPQAPAIFKQLAAQAQGDIDAAELPRMSPEAEAASQAAQTAARERVMPTTAMLPNGFKVGPDGTARMQFAAPDSLLNMQRIRAGKAPLDVPSSAPTQGVYLHTPDTAPSAIPEAKVVSSSVDGPPAPRGLPSPSAQTSGFTAQADGSLRPNDFHLPDSLLSMFGESKESEWQLVP